MSASIKAMMIIYKRKRQQKLLKNSALVQQYFQKHIMQATTKSFEVVCRPLLWTKLCLFFSLTPCVLYFWVQSQTNSMGMTARIKGLILRSSCCFFSLPMKPQGSGFIVFSVLSSLKITHKANNWFSCYLFPMRIQMSQVHKCWFFPTNCTSKNCPCLCLFRCQRKLLMKQ